MNDIYPLDIWHIVFNNCDFISKLKLISVCSIFYHSFFITDLYTISDRCKYRLTNTILKQKKFSRTIELSIGNWNDNINNISFLTNLKKLNIANSRGVDQQGISGLNLFELDVTRNKKITNISLMTNLKKLSAQGLCGIDQQGISGLNLFELNGTNNKKITTVSFMTNLKKLFAEDFCGIDQQGIEGLNQMLVIMKKLPMYHL